MRWITITFAAALTAIIVSANRGASPWLFQWVNLLPGRDLAGHFLLMGTMAFLLTQTLARSGLKIKHPYRVGALSFVVLVTVEEFSQIYLPNRRFSIADLSADYFGIIFFTLMSAWNGRRLDSKLEKPARLSENGRSSGSC